MRLDTAEYAYPVEFMCERLGVSRSGYYDWRHRPESATAGRREELKLLVTKAFTDSNRTYGHRHRRVRAQLLRWGAVAGLEPVRQIMRELGLVSCQPRPRRWSLTRPVSAPVPDLVGRDFTAAHYQTPLISRAIRNAARNRALTKGAIFHSDRGSNYLSAEYAAVLGELGLRRSVGRSGICFDNAMAESFFGTLKNERVSRLSYPTREEARRDIIRYIEFWYNRKRLHSSVGYRPPHEVHSEFEELRPAA